MEERRQDYINLPELLKANATNDKKNALNANDIKHMKDTLDKHGEDIADIKETQAEIATDIKCILQTTNTEIRILKIQVKWIIASIVAFFSGLVTIGTVYGKSILAFLATIIK